MQLVRIETGAPPAPGFVPHFGYNSIMPLALNLLPFNSSEFGALLQQLEAPELLWSPFGLRSLAANSSLFMEHNTRDDAPYWRGPVWINVNFLVLRTLRACVKCAPSLANCVLQVCVRSMQCCALLARGARAARVANLSSDAMRSAVLQRVCSVMCADRTM